MNYYNDNDPKVCAWLRELIAAGHLPPGTVAERSILDVKASDLAGYDQCHFFAGIGGWPLALRWAGLEGVAGIWTGSCPCQPLSCAGKRQGHADDRHLWPAFYSLISECRPATVFGEQVASKDGREWFAGVRLDLEDLGYACGGADLCAAGVGAPHRRQRIYWVADATMQRREGTTAWTWKTRRESTAERRSLGNACADGFRECGRSKQPIFIQSSHWSLYEIRLCRDSKQRRIEPNLCALAYGIPGVVGLLRGYGNAIVPQVAEVFVMSWMDCSLNAKP